MHRTRLGLWLVQGLLQIVYQAGGMSSASLKVTSGCKDTRTPVSAKLQAGLCRI